MAYSATPLATHLGLEERTLAAVLAVESRGLGHGLESGRPLIRLVVDKATFVTFPSRDAARPFDSLLPVSPDAVEDV